MNDVFSCGAARADITPAVGACLFGYVPDWVSKSVRDPLTITGAAFSDGKESVLLLSATLCEIQTALCDELREKAGAACGLPASRIILSATHTHSGPDTSGNEGRSRVDREYVEEVLLPAVERVAREAAGSMEPAVLGVGTAQSAVGVNRREIQPDGAVWLGQNPYGSYDPTMTVVSVCGTDGHGILNLVHYGCHGTAAGMCDAISRDWSGVMCDRLEAESGTLTAFWQGAEGDVGPRLPNGRTTGDIAMMEALGEAAAKDAAAAWRAVSTRRAVRVRLFTGDVRIPCRAFPAPEEVERKIAQYAETSKKDGMDAFQLGYYTDVREALLRGETAPGDFVFPQTLVALGDVLFVPLPFEMFSVVALRLRQHSPYAHTLCLSCANGSHSYFASMDQLARGGYEVMCFRRHAAQALADDAEQRLIDETLRLMAGRE